MRRALTGDPNKEGFEPDIIYTDSHMRNICYMVSSGMGIALLNERLIPKDIPGICTVPITPALVSRIYLCRSSKLELSPQQQEFLDYYRQGDWRREPLS